MSFKNSGMLNSELMVVKELLYDACGFNMTELNTEAESREYGASSFRLNGLKIMHRVSKITPTKTGQFVVVWKRDQAGITAPFDLSDRFDFIIITSRSGNRFGQFIFPKAALFAKGIISGNNKDGKRGIRVYAPWDKTNSKQAEKSQQWQTLFFVEITTGAACQVRTKELLGVH